MRDNSIRWMPVVGYEGIYEISETGIVWRCERTYIHNGFPRTLPGKPLRLHPDKAGYIGSTLTNGDGSKTWRVHRLVAMAFLANPNGLPCVNHKNGIKSDNSVANLEWCTRQHNVRHAFENGLFKPRHGTRNNRAVLDDSDVKCIFYLLVEGVLSNVAIGHLYGVNRQAISLIASGKTWRHLRRPEHEKLRPIVPALSLKYVPGMEHHASI